MAKHKPATHEQVERIEKKLEHIMATQAQLIQQAKDQAAALSDVSAGLTKISGEVDNTLKEIQDLKDFIANNPSEVSPELADAVNSVSVAAENLKAQVKAVDDKVPDPVPLQS